MKMHNYGLGFDAGRKQAIEEELKFLELIKIHLKVDIGHDCEFIINMITELKQKLEEMK